MTTVLETERLRFRVMEAADEADLERLDGNPNVRAFFPGGIASRPTSQQRIANNRASFTEHGLCDFIVLDRATGAFMGRAGMHRMEDGEVEVGYLFFEEHWGKGFATEALRGLLAWARAARAAGRLSCERIIAFAPARHLASLRVMEKSGMRPYKTDRLKGEDVDCVFHEAVL
jgi:[ribosomal protein S5]-alanine N-acetyltransferase